MKMLRGRSPRLLGLTALIAALALMSGCGEKSEGGPSSPQNFSLTLDFYPNPDHLGIYEAQQLGYFRAAGQNVQITSPSDPAAPIKEVAAGRTDLAISYEPEVMLARQQGLDVQAVGAIVNRPLTSLIWLRRSPVKRVADLRGKTIATAGIPYQAAYLKTILARVGLTPNDVKAVNVGLGLLPAILSGKTQAMLGGFTNVEGVDLAFRGKHPVVIPVNKLGVPNYDELVLVAQGKRLRSNPGPIRLFISALARGTAAAQRNPAQATRALLAANRSLDPEVTPAEVRATLPALSAAAGGHPFGYMDPAQWQAFIAWMRDNGLISALPTPQQVLSNDYLPGTIPR